MPVLYLPIFVEYRGFLGSVTWLTNSEDADVLSKHRREVQYDGAAVCNAAVSSTESPNTLKLNPTALDAAAAM